MLWFTPPDTQNKAKFTKRTQYQVLQTFQIPFLIDLKPSEVKASVSLNSMCFLLLSFCHFLFLQVFKSRIFILILSTPQEGGEVFSAKGIIKCSDKLTGLRPDISNKSNHSHQTTKKSK